MRIRKQFLEALDGAGANYREGGAVEGKVRNSFAGIKADTHNFSLLEKAERLEDVGKATSEEIRQQTGWFRGYDGKWRFEISDRDMEVDTTGKFHSNPDVRRYVELFDKAFVNMEATDTELTELRELDSSLKGVNMNPRTLGELIKHDKLFSAYPQLKDMTVHFADIDERGIYDPISKMIVIQTKLKLNKGKLEKTLVHEIQHAIQDIEGFTGGSSPDYWQTNGATKDEAYDYYERTAGEVEARDAASRYWRSDEAIKETRPDIDRTDVVFSDGEVSYSTASENSNSSIKTQIKDNIGLINKMEIVAEVIYNSKSKKELKDYVINEFKKIGFKVERQNFGVIEVGEKQIDKSLDYINSEAEKAALIAVPKVIKRGKTISGHGNHKSRAYDTLTIAAPISINGVRGNMAVVVRMTGKNRYHTHRILMPDGSEFKFEIIKKDSELTSSDMFTIKSEQGSDIGSESTFSISDSSENVKNSFSLNIDDSLKDLHRSTIDKVTELGKVTAQMHAHILRIGSNLTKRELSALKIQEIARKLKVDYASKLDIHDLSGRLTELYTLINEGGASYDVLRAHLDDIKERLLKESKYMKPDISEAAKERLREKQRSGAVRRRTAGRRRIWFAPKGRSKGPGAPVRVVPATAPRPHGLHSLSVMHCPCTSLGGHYPTPLAPPYPRTESSPLSSKGTVFIPLSFYYNCSPNL